MANVQSDHVPSAAVGAFRNFTATKAKGKKRTVITFRPWQNWNIKQMSLLFIWNLNYSQHRRVKFQGNWAYNFYSFLNAAGYNKHM